MTTATTTTTKMLQNAYGFEKAKANDVWLTQPMGGNVVKTLTWKQGFDEARRMAGHLQSLGLPAGTNIALLSKNTAWWLLADLAIWMAGHTSVPIYPTLAATTIKQILDHSGAKHIFIGKLDGWNGMKGGIGDDIQKIALPLGPSDVTTTWNDLIAKATPIAGDVARGDDELATIVYTSGTSGTPKGVMLTFGALSKSQAIAEKVLAITPNDRMLSYLPLAHVFERAVIECTTFYKGMQVFFAESLDTFVADVKRARPTVFHSVPRLWLKFQAGVSAKMPEHKLNRMLKIPILSGIVKKKILTGLGLDAVRMAVTGSAPIPPGVLTWYRNIGLNLLEAYGMSENFCISHINMPSREKVGSVGEVWPGVECRISAEGEIQVKTPTLMQGYYKAPELTKEAFTEDGFLKTGDRGEVDSMGRLRITGRVKELFKTSKGKYVAPAPIENALLENEFLETACVMGSGQPQPCALVTIAEAFRPQLKDSAVRQRVNESLEQHLKQANAKLDPHEQLEFVVVVKDAWTIESGVLTPTMKVKRAIVEERFNGALDGWYSKRTPVIWEDAAPSAATAQAAE